MLAMQDESPAAAGGSCTPGSPPQWAPRVKRSLIRRLYEESARGLLDDELVDEVGIALLARCRSILTVTEAVRGRIECPSCAAVFSRTLPQLRCPACEWSLAWERYRATYKGRQLFGGAALPAFREFSRRYPRAKRVGDKIVLIDTVLHEYHWNLIRGLSEPQATRPAAACLVDARGLADVIAFLDELSGTRPT